jgi:hemerythrin-like metal-binding protein
MSSFDAKLKLLDLPHMDDDHLQLVAIANKIDEIATKPHFDQIELAGAIAQFTLRTREHFLREERYMASVGFPALEVHMKEHATVLAALDKLVVPATTGQYISQNLRQYMAIWLFEHIDKVDSKYAAYVQEFGDGLSNR